MERTANSTQTHTVLSPLASHLLRLEVDSSACSGDLVALEVVVVVRPVGDAVELPEGGTAYQG